MIHSSTALSLLLQKADHRWRILMMKMSQEINAYLHNGLWRVVLHKDRWLKPADPRRAAAVVAHYKEWLPPWRVPAPAASSSQPTRKRSRS